MGMHPLHLESKTWIQHSRDGDFFLDNQRHVVARLLLLTSVLEDNDAIPRISVEGKVFWVQGTES
jgi:hypothetical protein